MVRFYAMWFFEKEPDHTPAKIGRYIQQRLTNSIEHMSCLIFIRQKEPGNGAAIFYCRLQLQYSFGKLQIMSCVVRFQKYHPYALTVYR